MKRSTKTTVHPLLSTITSSSCLPFCLITGFTPACSCSNRVCNSLCSGCTVIAWGALCQLGQPVGEQGESSWKGLTDQLYTPTDTTWQLRFFCPLAGKRKFVWWTPQKDSQNIWRGTSSQTQVLRLNRVSQLFWFNCTQLHTPFFVGRGSFNSTCRKAQQDYMFCMTEAKKRVLFFRLHRPLMNSVLNQIDSSFLMYVDLSVVYYTAILGKLQAVL